MKFMFLDIPERKDQKCNFCQSPLVKYKGRLLPNGKEIYMCNRCVALHVDELMEQ